MSARESFHQSKSNEHYTPLAIVEAARETLGAIDLDPATTARVNRERVMARSYFVMHGLIEEWHGRVFLNPPGGLIHPKTFEPVAKGGVSSQLTWWDRLAAEWLAGRVESAIFVAFSLELLQSSQKRAVPLARFPFCLPESRIRFENLDPAVPEGPFQVGRSPSHANAIGFLPPFPKDQRADIVRRRETGRWLGLSGATAEAMDRFETAFTPFGEVVIP